MVERESIALGGCARCLITLIGLFWLTLGIFVATSPRIAPKMMQWNYVLAWILLFGFPCTFFLWLGLHGLHQKPKMALIKKSENKERLQNLMQGELLHKSEKDVMEIEDKKAREKEKPAEMVYVEDVHFIPTKQIISKELSETKFCRHCHAIISKNEYETYGGLCYGCYIDFKREIRRSGLFGADRASTW